MRYTLMSRGSTLGHTGAELSGLSSGSRGWHFIAAPGFDAIRPTLMELQQATLGLQELMPSPDTLAGIREEERSAFVRNALLSDPHAARFLALMDEVEALSLELRDEHDVALPTRTVGVTELEMTPEAFREMLAAIDPNADPALSEVPPFYLLVAGTAAD